MVLSPYNHKATFFEWDDKKNLANLEKHGISFDLAQEAFFDPYHLIVVDAAHSTQEEKRYFCFGKVSGRVVTVRFTIRNDKIRPYGAGFWRKGTKYYEETYA